MFYKFLYRTGIHTALKKWFGLDRSLEKLIHEMTPSVSTNTQILDVGCGTGVLGLSLLRRFPKAILYATDIEPRYLSDLLLKMKKLQIDRNNVLVGISDIETPDKIELLSGTPVLLDRETFDFVSAGAVIGYSQNQQQTLLTLARLVKANGYLINIEMSERLIGRFISSLYQYSVISIEKMKGLLEKEGFEVKLIPISIRYFPANLVRILISAKKVSQN